MSHSDKMKALVEAGAKHHAAFCVLDPALPYWQQQMVDFNLRRAVSAVGHVACDARDSIALAHEIAEAARDVAAWANPGDEVCSPLSDTWAAQADKLRALLARYFTEATDA